MPEPKLSDISRHDVAFILDYVEGLPLHEKREKLYRWALDRGSNMSLVEALLYEESSYAEDLAAFKVEKAALWEAKLKEDQDNMDRLRKLGRWDEVHNCEIPTLNSDDPKERRFNHNAGSNSSYDVTWDSHTYTPPKPEPEEVLPTP